MKKILAAVMLLAMTITMIMPGNSAYAADTSKFVLFDENDKLEFYIDSSSLSIRVLDKESGYIWASDRSDSEEEKLNNMWKNRVNSGVMIDYYDNTLRKSGTAAILDGSTVNITSNNGYVFADVSFDSLEISFTLEFALNGSTLSVELKNESIKENNMLLKSITLFPFLGSTNQSEYINDGYILIPDGCGALIEYGKRTVSVSNPYKSRLFGGDLSIGAGTTGYPVIVPVYGIVNGINKNAFYAEAEKGGAYAELFSNPAGGVVNYNWTGFSFNYRQNYFQQTSGDGSGFTTIEENRVEYDIKLNYTFLNGESANYTGIACDYRERLENLNLLTEKNNSNAFVRLNILGSEIKRSFLWTSEKSYTSVAQTKNIISDMLEEGINPVVDYMGYYSGGRSSFPLSMTKLNKKLGSEKDFSELVSYTGQNNVPLYFSGDYLQVKYNTSGISKSNDLLRSIDQKVYKDIYYIGLVHSFDVSFLNYKKLMSVFNKDLEVFEKKNMNISVADVGSLLYGDYSSSGLNREQAKGYLPEIFGSNDIKIAFNSPNYYMWGQTDRFFDMPDSSTGYIMFTKDVPFLQILLKGYIDYYSETINSAGNPADKILKLLEYGIYPSYYVTAESPQDLLYTPLSFIFSSEYDIWSDKIKSTSNYVKEVLEPVAGAKIIGHEYDDKSMTAVTLYDNNKMVLVNYSDKDTVINGYTIPAKSAVIRG